MYPRHCQPRFGLGISRQLVVPQRYGQRSNYQHFPPVSLNGTSFCMPLSAAAFCIAYSRANRRKAAFFVAAKGKMAKKINLALRHRNVSDGDLKATRRAAGEGYVYWETANSRRVVEVANYKADLATTTSSICLLKIEENESEILGLDFRFGLFGAGDDLKSDLWRGALFPFPPAHPGGVDTLDGVGHSAGHRFPGDPNNRSAAATTLAFVFGSKALLVSAGRFGVINGTLLGKSEFEYSSSSASVSQRRKGGEAGVGGEGEEEEGVDESGIGKGGGILNGWQNRATMKLDPNQMQTAG
ncbi:hypothetical protein C8J56DRAFT_893481 [Mycena floridula]|nr:hypothetical protein C8J56DRAFT_893481 [Mycena floridula]